MADHFDRLAGRTAPDGGTAPRVQPRLPGPFERIDTLGADPEPPPSAPARPAERPVPLPAPLPAAYPAHRKAEPAPPRPVPLPLALRETPAPEHGALLAPAVPPPPPQPVAGREPSEPVTVRAVGPQPHTEPGPHLPAPPAVRPAAARPAAPAVAAPAHRPGTAGRTAPADPAGRERQPRPPERVVHVSIGRLEVTAAGRRPDAGRRAERAGRADPGLSLRTYLSGQEARR